MKFNSNIPLYPDGGVEPEKLMKIALIPSWMRDALESSSEGIKAATDCDKLLTILSKEDVAFYIYINSSRNIEKLFGAEVKSSLIPVGDKMMDSTPGTPIDYEGEEPGKERKEALKKYKDLWSMIEVYHDQYSQGGTRTPSDLLSELLGPDFENFDSDGRHIDYEAVLLTEDTIAVTPKASDGALPYAFRRNLYSKMLGILCSVHTFARVADTPLFKGYISTYYENG